ncbi:SIS domain-containing protein [Aliirhizobium cellulosilyticum]|jgi:glucosamine--fructose-6-phosphate aminotransferase (isomerizing)|uniref:Glucosamine--fructose-6-phosphate aminotransferase (Isomerizing) n=1 Tax=Aliirhizobium cellulosilyticum TaxID=393664 RepID=A0A7W6V180_9HYPH|nr:SIS domain-containing protein [Rhizobium cellulosilyticum]MBB4349155.1 glucosamine--fructose-6-phosphate aminotransferase (isomerizing) [Rhizobium cellulosilyticum]MBB4412624.1 glucosamine--fructose-6-phosphate aminotransferase (isomerizing) [Rhizobium cellulosilyticum]MBB4447256.1 glucosamine--fructose-6-phosphate aminotransferase (isomerizing) [Rhizobium cellulosilyticum]
MLTHMRQEINEIPEAATRLLDRSAADLAKAGRALRDKDPAFLVTIARGSSDHAATFIKYAIELTAGRPVASLGPSLASIYGADLKLGGGAAIAISQSGKSPDIVAMAEAATKSGAVTVALTNTLPSPITQASLHAVDINAGPELAVAATKSFVNSIVAGLALLSEWTGDDALKAAVRALPDHLAKAVTLDWSEFSGQLGDAESLYMLGRGPALAIASEAALKFKETSNMHAEAYSAAEVLHGPVALVEDRFPVLAFAARDAAEASIVEIVDSLAGKRAMAFATSGEVKAANKLPFIATGHPLTDALALIVPFYGFVEAWSRSKGFNPDQPAALKKVTETL